MPHHFCLSENQRRWDPECEGGELGLLWYSQASSMMASLESQAQASRSHDDPPVSVSYCQSLGEGQFVHWKKGKGDWGTITFWGEGWSKVIFVWGVQKGMGEEGFITI